MLLKLFKIDADCFWTLGQKNSLKLLSVEGSRGRPRCFFPPLRLTLSVDGAPERRTGGRAAEYEGMLGVFLVSPAVSGALNPVIMRPAKTRLWGAALLFCTFNIPFPGFLFFLYFIIWNGCSLNGA